MNNLGYHNGKILLLDYDTIYDLMELNNPPECLRRWMVERFNCEDDDDFTTFSKNHYDTWKTDWLS